MKYTFSLVFAFCMGITLAWAQGKFSFEKETHDFGNIEEGTIAKYEFTFKNTGNQPIVIQSVNASCGCTTPFYTKEPIPPGQVGKITASYNSNGRPNSFNKSITIKSNASEPMKVLYIKGFVNPKYQPEQNTASSSAVLSLDKTVANVGKLKLGQTGVARFTITNTGTGNLILTGVNSDCKCVIADIKKANLQPKESTVVELKYTPKSGGNMKDAIHIFSNDGRNGRTVVYVTADVENDNILKENKANNPFGF